MKFVHEDAEWRDLLAIVAGTTGKQVAFVEKDYWVAHALWALGDQGFEIWFKGGTSLSKGFSLIERFSEDLDVRLDAGTVAGLTTPVLPWDDSKKNRRQRGIAEREAWFQSLAARILVPGCSVRRNPLGSDERVRSAWIEVAYPILHAAALPPEMRDFVLLEVGHARVVPSVDCQLSSWVHDYLGSVGQLATFVDNRPRVVRCVHPLVTCLEKLEAIARKFDKGKAAADFIRHYEDAARIVVRREALPPLEDGLTSLVERLANEDGKHMPPASHAAFNPADDERWRLLESAWIAIGPMYWGPRMALTDATAVLRAFLSGLEG